MALTASDCAPFRALLASRPVLEASAAAAAAADVLPTAPSVRHPALKLSMPAQGVLHELVC